MSHGVDKCQVPIHRQLASEVVLCVCVCVCVCVCTHTCVCCNIIWLQKEGNPAVLENVLDLESTILSERSQAEKDNTISLTYMWNIGKKKKSNLQK